MEIKKLKLLHKKCGKYANIRDHPKSDRFYLIECRTCGTKIILPKQGFAWDLEELKEILKTIFKIREFEIGP